MSQEERENCPTDRQHDNRFIYLLTVARQRLVGALNGELLKKAGVTAAQAGALFIIQEHNGCTLTRLSRGLMSDNSAITGLVDRLEKQRLVKRERDRHDRRAITVSLTDEGKRALRQAAPVVHHFNQALQEGFTTKEVAAFRRILKGIIQRFEPGEAQTEEDNR